MNTQESLKTANDRIAEHRMRAAELVLTDPLGRPVAEAGVEVALERHAFRFGANAFCLGAIEDEALQQAYEERFTALLNYATLPFYWGGYEPQAGATQQERLRQMATWCRDHGIRAKGHPLVWHEVYPSWAEGLPDTEVMARQEARVRDVVAEFGDLIPTWDVVNEATVSHRVENAVGRWMKAGGAADCVARALEWARAANPRAELLYNDFNVSPELEDLLAALQERGAPFHVIGIQSHMHKGAWPLEKVWETCQTCVRFGLPLHWTENTVLSGRLKAADDEDWHRQRDDWPTTVAGEEAQAEYGEQLYALLFSHPAVDAITWWDFSDLHAWQGAPAGLVRRDMSPKPLYERLMALIHRVWHTREQLVTDAGGTTELRGYCGEYAVAATTASGDTLSSSLSLQKDGPARIVVQLSPDSG